MRFGLWWAVVAWLVVCLAGCAGELKPEVQQSNLRVEANKPPPNIVILMADDLGYGDLGSYGHPTSRTPNLDSLAAQGQRWTDFYAAAPVCSPSRGALMTGQYPTRSGLYGKRIAVMFPNEAHGIDPEVTTLAEALQAQGYATGMVGKWHLGDAKSAYPTRHGFDFWYGIPYSNDMDWTNSLSFDELIGLSLAGASAELAQELATRQPRYFAPQVDYWNVPLLRSERVGPNTFIDTQVERPAQQPTITKRYTEQAIEFIDQHAAEPFLLYVPYNMPHTPLFASDQFAQQSHGGPYADVIEELDWSVGAIVEKLQAMGLAENTLVVFTSDNGPWLLMRHHGGSAGLLSNGKGTTFEGGMRVPAIFWWPGTIEAGTVHQMGSIMDLYQTALHLAGAPVQPQATDSLDLGPTLLDAQQSSRSEFAYYRAGELTAYRLGAYKLRLVSEGAYQMPPARQVFDTPQLFHLGEDPGEQFDLAAQQPDKVVEVQQAIAVHRASLTPMPPLFDRRLARLAKPSE
jgi:arylsulfatase A